MLGRKIFSYLQKVDMTRHCRSSKRWQLNLRVAASYLTGRDELQRAQGGAHVLDVVLELVESIGDAALDLRGVLARRRVGGDLVEVRHDGQLSTRERDVRSVKVVWRRETNSKDNSQP